jgi:type IV pilus assembly protein PilC
VKEEYMQHIPLTNKFSKVSISTNKPEQFGFRRSTNGERATGTGAYNAVHKDGMRERPQNVKPKYEEYTWHGIDKNGKRCNGTINATHLTAASLELNQQNITLLKIIPTAISTSQLTSALTSAAPSSTSLSLLSSLRSSFKNKIKPTQLANFMQQLSYLTNSHMPLTTILETLSKEQTNPTLQQLIQQIKKAVEAGSTLTMALQKYPQYFPPLWCNLIHTGEKSGTLDIMLQLIARHITAAMKYKQKFIKALLYPIMVLLVGAAVTALLLLLVIPQFQNTFANFGATLPAYTQFIINLAQLLRDHGLSLIAALTGAIASVHITYRRSPWCKQKFDCWLIRIPIYHKAVTLTYTRLLNITMKAGMPLLAALQITARNITNWRYRQAIIDIQNSIIHGRSLYHAMRAQNLFNEYVMQLVALGEESGNLDNIFGTITERYEEEINYIVDNLHNLLEPLLMVVLGVVVGGLIIGMYLPIFRLGNII